MIFKHIYLKVILRKSIKQAHVQRQKLLKWAAKTQNDQVKLTTVKNQRQRNPDQSNDAAFCESKLSV
ncbi:hypothetical protein AAY54_17435 [Vibrio metoecus]|nr:hypothetical protein AAY54_17435 [Vibrio metoecus]